MLESNRKVSPPTARRGLRHVQQAGQCLEMTVKSLLPFELQFGLVLFEKRTELFRLIEQAGPLLVIQGDGKSAQAIDADTAFFTHAKLQRSGAAPGGLFFQFSEAGFEFFVGWFCHVVFSRRGFYQNKIAKIARIAKIAVIERQNRRKFHGRRLLAEGMEG